MSKMMKRKPTGSFGFKDLFVLLVLILGLSFWPQSKVAHAQAQWTDQSGLSLTTGVSIGIGTTEPDAKLHVYGNGNKSYGVLGLNSTSAGGDGTIAFLGPYAYLNSDSAGASYWSWGHRYDGDANVWVRRYPGLPLVQAMLDTGGNFKILTDTSTTSSPPFFTDRFIVTNAGNVGIGTTAPDELFHLRSTVNGQTVQVLTDGWSGAERGLRITSNLGGAPIDRWKIGAPSDVNGDPGSNIGSDFRIQRFDDAGQSLGTSVFIKRSSGDVGIGTATPDGRLTLDAPEDTMLTIKRGGTNMVVLGDTGSGNMGSLRLYDSSGNVMSVISAVGTSYFSGGNVGIGAPSADAMLRVNNTTGQAGLYLTHTNTNSTANGLEVYATGLANQLALAVGGSIQGASAYISGLVVQTGGNVGIGTSTPSTKPHVVGDVTVTGNIAAKYQDVAEWVPSSMPLTAGMVVVLDKQRSNQVLPSLKSYDTTVAGVVSDQPGIILGEAGEGKAMVATTGRVKVRVDASKKGIQVGDLLVTSDKEGIAMNSEPLDLGGVPIHRPGTLIGKALEPLKEGEGEILVLLSLQ